MQEYQKLLFTEFHCNKKENTDLAIMLEVH